MVAQCTRRAVFAAAVLWATCLSAAEPAQRVIEQLDPPRRAKAVMALVGLAVLGLALVALIWLGGSYVRRVIRKPLPRPRSSPDDWSQKPLVPRDAEPPDPEPL